MAIIENNGLKYGNNDRAICKNRIMTLKELEALAEEIQISAAGCSVIYPSHYGAIPLLPRTEGCRNL